MLQDEILDEIRQFREEHAKSYLDAMFADWQKRQAEDGRQVVSLSPKRPLKSRWSRPNKNNDKSNEAIYGGLN